MSRKKELYLFDFDGTITQSDSLLHFLAFSRSRLQLFGGYLFILPYVLLMKLKLYSNEKAKTKLFSYHFKGMSIEEFDRLCHAYGKNELPKIIKTSFLDYLKALKQENKDRTIVVVSASFRNYLKYWSDGMGFDLLCTELEVKNKTLTGKFATKNCYGMEKVKRINAIYDLSEYHEINVFGDSRGDKEMLLLGNNSYYNYFK
ncbi:MAG: haloacid dehalogenase-like hydrolase [Eudoraea sp.]|nr:haloacid dehalogenase-like hydrolase [Eudoraea sp.]